MELAYRHWEYQPFPTPILRNTSHQPRCIAGKYKYQTWIHQKGLSNISMSDVGHSLHRSRVHVCVSIINHQIDPVSLFITKNPAIYWLLRDEGCFLGCGNNDTGLYRSKSLQFLTQCVCVQMDFHSCAGVFCIVCCASHHWNHHSHCSLFSFVTLTNTLTGEFNLNTRTVC
ncbi:hypothetical protein Q7C36_008511 [Tachysurus vachellii]|uniref:Uncharacterized protein n=1 Tax=Tachysurus vachellii TaxID=175792 RepID=A0AA88N2P1_TACVA|nr:hypothetical protein Q7C36_008511 [Tachysurus vachellii]